MELGAECQHYDEAETLTADDLRRYAPNPMLKAAVEALVLRHPGHPNQKTHGNRFGAGQAKESLRRLKDDKGARERYKQQHRTRAAPIPDKISVLPEHIYKLPSGEHRTKELSSAIKAKNIISKKLLSLYNQGKSGGIYGDPVVSDLERKQAKLQRVVGDAEHQISSILNFARRRQPNR